MATQYLGNRQSYRQSTNTNHLNKKLRAVSAAEEESNKRNQEYLQSLTKVSKQAASLNEKTEKLRKVKHNYEDYINRLYPQWCEYMETVKESPCSKTSPNKREANKEKSRSSPPKFIDPQFDDERDMYPEFLQRKMERWRNDESLDLTLERHDTSVSPPRRSPNIFHRSPSNTRHSPNNPRHSPNKLRHSPNNHRHSTNNHRFSPDNPRHLSNIPRHSPNNPRSPDNHHRSTNNHNPNQNTSFDMYHDSFYGRPKPFLPANELNERMKATYRSPQEYSNPGTYSGLFLPVSHEFASERRHEKMEDFENHKNIDFENHKNIDFEKKGFANESLLNNSMNFGTDLSNVTILPQLLGINGDGQLVLVPLASSFNPNGSFNNTLSELAAKHRFSPVGRNSDSPAHTPNPDENTTLSQTVQVNPAQISTLLNGQANKQRKNKGKQGSPSLSSKQEEEKQSADLERQRQIKDRQKEREEEKRKQEEKRLQEERRLQELEEERIRQEELKRKEEQRHRELQQENEQRQEELRLQEQEREMQRHEKQKQLEIQEKEQQRQLEIQRQEQQRQFELQQEEQQRHFEVEREKQQRQLELKRQEQQNQLDLELREQRRKLEEEQREQESLRELEQERQRELQEQQRLKELQEQEEFKLKQQQQQQQQQQQNQQNQQKGHQEKESSNQSKGKSLKLFSKLKNLGKSSPKKHQVKEEVVEQQDSRQTFQQEKTLNENEDLNDYNQSPGTSISHRMNDIEEGTEFSSKLSSKKDTNNGSSEAKKSSPTLETLERKSERSKDSIFSDFSEHSEFDLPSNADDPLSSLNLPKSPLSPLIEPRADAMDGSQNQELASDLHPLMFIMERLTEKVKDEESEEVLALNIDVDINQANTILGNAELEGNLDQFSSSELCMSFRYQVEQMFKKRDVPFIIHPVDKDSDFEGNLRDCINPCFLELWDSLFMFLSETMSVFEFDPVQVATIFAHVLIPSNKKQKDQFQSSLGKILASLAEDSESESDETDDEEDGGNNNQNTNISITEEITTKTPVSRSGYTSPQDKPSATEKGDLSKTLSFENDDDSSSTVSFDSDGLPVRRPRKQDNTSDSSPHNNDSLSEASSALNISGSKAYQDMYRESLMSPVHEDIDDDEDLEDLLGESIGLKKSEKPRNPPSSSSILSPLSKSADSSTSKHSTSKKINLKKPGFWDSESDSELDLNNTGKSGGQVKSQANDGDDDFDFDFYD